MGTFENKTITVCNHCNATNRIDIDAARKKTAICGKCKASLDFHEFVSDLGFDQLQKIILRAEDTPVIVDFWAPWCGPCLSFATTYERVASRHIESVIFVKVDTEAHPEAAETFRIQGIPTLVVFKGGSERTRQSGALPESSFEDWLLNAIRF